MANVEFHQGNTLKDITDLTILVTVFFGNVPSLYIPFIRQRQVEKGRCRQRQVEKGRSGQRQAEAGRQRQAEAEERKVVGNVPSLYIPFIKQR